MPIHEDPSEVTHPLQLIHPGGGWGGDGAAASCSSPPQGRRPALSSADLPPKDFTWWGDPNLVRDEREGRGEQDHYRDVFCSRTACARLPGSCCRCVLA